MILLDTSVLIDAFTGPKKSARTLRALAFDGRILMLPSLVLYEWLRGPRTRIELQDQEATLPSASALPFGPEEAAVAADLYRMIRRPRSHAIDIGIAAIAIRHKAQLWTLNKADFAEIPGLRLYST